MQQGLRPLAQDENAMSALHRPAALFKGGLAEGGNGGLNKGMPALSGVRKALGNIANSRAGAKEGAGAGKTPGGGFTSRRALGDITNSQAPSALKAALKPASASSKAGITVFVEPEGGSAITMAATTAADRASVLGEGGVERRAGSSWEELEAGRLAREDAEIAERLSALFNFRPCALPTFYPHWVSL
jgi:hypothetical protein